MFCGRLVGAKLACAYQCGSAARPAPAPERAKLTRGKERGDNSRRHICRFRALLVQRRHMSNRKSEWASATVTLTEPASKFRQSPMTAQFYRRGRLALRVRSGFYK